LSGFLIGSIFIKSFAEGSLNKKNLFSFWLKRWLRTLPAYLVVLSALVVLSFVNGKGPGAGSIIRLYTFTQNLYYPQPVTFFPEAWSLSVEEWFYLLFPVSIFFLINATKLSFRYSLVLIAMLVIVLITINRISLYSYLQPLTIDEWDTHLRKEVFTRLDSIMFGVIAAYIRYYHPGFWRLKVFISFLAGLTFIFFTRYATGNDFGLFNSVFSFTASSFGVMLLLPLLETVRYSDTKLNKAITFIALISYSMYLLNLSVIQIAFLEKIDLTFIPKIGVLLKYVLYWFLTIFLSYALYSFVELPFMRLRNKLPK
jgi:peptidoglycan/LPS O-acetylase OafA/YrhL